MNGNMYNEYDIHIDSIWSNEISLFYKGRNRYNFMSKVEELVQITISNNSEPQFSNEMLKNGTESDKEYYRNNVDRYEKSLNDPKEKYMSDFFFHKGKCFQYDSCQTPILRKNEEANFEFWFVLELRRYENQISKIAEFFNHQLKSNFKNETSDFLHFLKLALKQHVEIIPPKVLETANEVFLNLTKTNSSKQRRSKKNVKGGKFANHFSFTLEAFVENKKYFENNALQLMEIFQEIKNNFFGDKTSFEQFKAILSGSVIRSSDRIDWTGSLVELSIFVKLLNYDLHAIVPIKNGLWDTTVKCFTKNGDTIRPEQLSKANGKKDRQELLISILKKL